MEDGLYSMTYTITCCLRSIEFYARWDQTCDRNPQEEVQIEHLHQLVCELEELVHQKLQELQQATLMM